jgi:hypothetical protein
MGHRAPRRLIEGRATEPTTSGTNSLLCLDTGVTHDEIRPASVRFRESIRRQKSELAHIQISEADHYAARAAILSLVRELVALIEVLDCLLDEKRDQERANAASPKGKRCPTI